MYRCRGSIFCIVAGCELAIKINQFKSCKLDRKFHDWRSCCKILKWSIPLSNRVWHPYGYCHCFGRIQQHIPMGTNRWFPQETVGKLRCWTSEHSGEQKQLSTFVISLPAVIKCLYVFFSTGQCYAVRCWCSVRLLFEFLSDKRGHDKSCFGYSAEGRNTNQYIPSNWFCQVCMTNLQISVKAVSLNSVNYYNWKGTVKPGHFWEQILYILKYTNVCIS